MQTDRDLMTPDEVAHYLHIRKETVYRYITNVIVS